MVKCVDDDTGYLFFRKGLKLCSNQSKIRTALEKVKKISYAFIFARLACIKFGLTAKIVRFLMTYKMFEIPIIIIGAWLLSLLFVSGSRHPEPKLHQSFAESSGGNFRSKTQTG